jgi:hypothetical protein
MQQFHTDSLICATAYVEARHAEEAHRLIAEVDGSGSDPNGSMPDHEPSWGEDSPARCLQCRWAGRAADLKAAREKTTVHVLVMHGDEEIRSIRVFATRAEAVACRQAIVSDHWGDWLGNEVMPDDPEAAFQRFDEEAGIEGLCIHLEEVEMAACA